MRKSRAVECCTVASTVCESSVWNLFHVIHPAPRILRWLLDFWKKCVSLFHKNGLIGARRQEKYEIKRLGIPGVCLDGHVPCSVDITTAYLPHSALPVGGS